MKRLYESILHEHYKNHNEAIFLSGPRQVGKTTIATQIKSDFLISKYLNWDDVSDRVKILARDIEVLNNTYATKPLLIFDEIHKLKDWKTYLKGIFDKHKHDCSFLVTGSSRLNVYRKGGDSMMGRYFLYRVHPLSVAELLTQTSRSTEFIFPCALDDVLFQDLLRFGGFPKPLLTADQKTYNRWKNQRLERLFEEDIRDVLRVNEIKKLQTFAYILQSMAGQQINFTSLSKLIQVSDQTIRVWLAQLEAFYHCFTIRPWSTNVIRSLIKDPKVYLWDWSLISDKGQKNENFIASHLLKAVHYWTDDGFGQFDLYYLRDKDKKEVDFLVTKDNTPWIMIEVKSSILEPLSNNLQHFQKQLNAPYVFQVAMDGDFIETDCFEIPYGQPRIVSAKTFLSQLV